MCLCALSGILLHFVSVWFSAFICRNIAETLSPEAEHEIHLLPVTDTPPLLRGSAPYHYNTPYHLNGRSGRIERIAMTRQHRKGRRIPLPPRSLVLSRLRVCSLYSRITFAPIPTRHLSRSAHGPLILIYDYLRDC